MTMRGTLELVSKMVYRAFLVRARLQPCRKKPEKSGASAPEGIFDLPGWIGSPIFETGSISREKEIKGRRQAKKIALIESTNPAGEDLAAKWFALPVKKTTSANPSSWSLP